MPTETLDDILEELADKLGLYECPSAMEEYCTLSISERNCRLCFTAKIKDRITVAAEPRIRAQVADKMIQKLVQEIAKGL